MEEHSRIFDSLPFSNLQALAEEQGSLFELRICELSEIAEEAAKYATEIFSSGVSMCELLALISEENAFISSEAAPDTIRENIFRLNSFLSRLAGSDKSLFATLFTEKLRERGLAPAEKDFLPVSMADETVTYVKNALADEAYEVFSQQLSDPRVAYSNSFKEAIDATLEGKVGYSLVPIEEKDGSRIPGIMSMIYSSDLKIISVTPVFGFEGTADVKYALLSAGFDIPRINSGDDRYLEILLSAEGDVPLQDVLCAASDMRVECYRLNSVILGGEERGIYYSVVFRTDSDFSEFLLYLTLFCGDFSPVGLYKNLE